LVWLNIEIQEDKHGARRRRRKSKREMGIYYLKGKKTKRN
jgi:hypothetical protein